MKQAASPVGLIGRKARVTFNAQDVTDIFVDVLQETNIGVLGAKYGPTDVSKKQDVFIPWTAIAVLTYMGTAEGSE
jgi:hypothetical protein